MRDDVKSLLWTGALLLFVRGYVVEPFKIPSGSMIPTLLVGDHLFVAKSSYDLGIPFTNIKLVHVSDPKRGDVVVFEYPNNENNEDKKGLYYIKRLIGVPGDRIAIHGGVPEINGQLIAQEPYDNANIKSDIPNYPLIGNEVLFREVLPGMDHPHWVQRYTHVYNQWPALYSEWKARQKDKLDCYEVKTLINADIYAKREIAINEVCPFTVPEGQYFMMGDNRDGSEDSRVWGFVERKLFKGRALFIWLPWNSNRTDEEGGSPGLLRWGRFGLRIL